jgi:hypothetical protein
MLRVAQMHLKEADPKLLVSPRLRVFVELDFDGKSFLHNFLDRVFHELVERVQLLSHQTFLSEEGTDHSPRVSLAVNLVCHPALGHYTVWL